MILGPARSLTALMVLVAGALVACARLEPLGPEVTVESIDGQPITVECRTDVPFAHGDCGGWGATVLQGDPDNVLDVRGVTRIILSGSIRPGPDQDRCNADLYDGVGRRLRSVGVACYVPSGG
jgi:hypothetical protein